MLSSCDQREKLNTEYSRCDSERLLTVWTLAAADLEAWWALADLGFYK